MSDVNTLVKWDEAERKTTFLRVQDVEPILDNNKELRSLDQTNTDGMKHIASIPNVVIEKWLHEEMDRGNKTLRLGSEEFDRIIAKKLADPDNAYLRTDKPSLIVGWLGFGS